MRATSERASVRRIVADAAEAFRPPKRMTVAEGAQTYLVINQPGGYSGPWDPTETPYMVSPMNDLASRVHEAVCFVGPARTGKTMGLLDGWIAHAAVCDPGDMLVVQMTQEKAREYSKTRVDRAFRHSPDLRRLLSPRANDDNTHDKLLRHGMWLKIGWPSASQLSSSDYRYVALTDYDRMPDDIDGEGAAYGLGLKRTQTFLSRGMCMVESSPGREVLDPNWRPASPHEAPPCTGIMGIYNRSDRHRWYWPCPNCNDFHEARPGLQLFATLPSEKELLEIVRTADLPALAEEHAVICCPRCGTLIEARHKPAMNLAGLWLAEGQAVNIDRGVTGARPRASIAGYWLGGVAAAYQKWDSLLLRYLQGLREYALTGSEETLRTTLNTDQGVPYISRARLEDAGDGAGLQARAEPVERYIVQDGVRALFAAVDVQKGRFEVGVIGFGVGAEQWLVDRYAIRDVNPASRVEDWDQITERVVKSTYRLPDGRELRVHMTAVDSGGQEGVTDKAYAWWRSLKASGLHRSVRLVKGRTSGPRVEETYPDSRKRKDRKAGSKGDVPVLMLNTNMLKDAVRGDLQRDAPGPGYIHFPSWLPANYFDELFAEVRGPNGWDEIPGRRNETSDHFNYVRALWIFLGGEKVRWNAPPSWCAEWDSNLNVMSADERREMKARVVRKPRPRVVRSKYMGR